jgi:hypothetical protein
MLRLEPVRESRWLDHAGYAAEYRAALAALDLPLPSGVSLPSEPAPEPEPGALYEEGAGEVAVLFEWLHAVECAAIGAHRRGDTEVAQHWVTVAAGFIDTDTFAKYNDPDVPISWYDAVIIPARAGHFAAMADEVDARTRPERTSCPPTTA